MQVNAGPTAYAEAFLVDEKAKLQKDAHVRELKDLFRYSLLPDPSDIPTCYFTCGDVSVCYNQCVVVMCVSVL
jgi:hypothetical protein